MSTTLQENSHTTMVDDIRVETHPSRLESRVVALLRISMGWVFLWAFLDKTFGLGFATAGEDAWINGGSPTFGYLNFGTEGKALHDFFAGLAGSTADWLFMLGLLAIGTALVLGIGLRVAAVAGSALLALMWLASLPLENNPFFDDHIAYALVLVLVAAADGGRVWGLGTWWADQPLVRRMPFLR